MKLNCDCGNTFEITTTLTPKKICHFCFKAEKDVKYLVIGQNENAFICDECVKDCSELLTKHEQETAKE